MQEKFISSPNIGILSGIKTLKLVPLEQYPFESRPLRKYPFLFVTTIF
jgi:hypothetical protein